MTLITTPTVFLDVGVPISSVLALESVTSGSILTRSMAGERARGTSGAPRVGIVLNSQ